MADEAHFSRVDGAEGAQFDITPASLPASQGCLFVCGYGFAGVIILGALRSADPIPALFLTSIFWGPVLLLMFWVAKKLKEKHPRVPTRLVVNAEGIMAGGKTFKASDIVELVLGHPGDRGGYGMAVYSGNTAYNAGRAVSVERLNRSFALMARLKSSSTPEVLVFGLTENVGRALLHDVSGAMA